MKNPFIYSNDNKRYHTWNYYLKTKFNNKVFKVPLNANFSCPNRDGTIGFGGCIFCSGSGSGDFATSVTHFPTVSEQIANSLALMGNKKTGTKYVAYFQAFTNTYGPIEKLRKLYTEALNSPMIIGLSIGTRPDCLGEDVLTLLSELKQTYPNKFIWIELGLQTIHESTALFIRRGYPLEVFDKTAQNLHQIGIPFIVHIILGLPGEHKSMILETIDYLNQIRPFGIKLQLLHILKETDLAAEYTAGTFDALTEESYFDLLGSCICRLRPDIVIHRITGDGPKNLLIAPLWSANKRGVLNHLHHYFKNHNIYQGKDFYEPGTIDSI